MTPSPSKSIRDGALGGGSATVAALVLLHFGFSEWEALALAPVVAGFAAYVWRVARKRWPGLDPTEPRPAA